MATLDYGDGGEYNDSNAVELGKYVYFAFFVTITTHRRKP